MGGVGRATHLNDRIRFTLCRCAEAGWGVELPDRGARRCIHVILGTRSLGAHSLQGGGHYLGGSLLQVTRHQPDIASIDGSRFGPGTAPSQASRLSCGCLNVRL